MALGPTCLTVSPTCQVALFLLSLPPSTLSSSSHTTTSNSSSPSRFVILKLRWQLRAGPRHMVRWRQRWRVAPRAAAGTRGTHWRRAGCCMGRCQCRGCGSCIGTWRRGARVEVARGGLSTGGWPWRAVVHKQPGKRPISNEVELAWPTNRSER